MRTSSFGWVHATVLTCAIALGACGSDPPPASAVTTCTPACNAGLTCVSGTCTALCNPACGAGQVCTAHLGGNTCELGSPDGATGDIIDATPPGDAPLTDTTPLPDSDPLDAQPPGDAPPPTDVMPPTDTMLPPSDVPGRPACGMTGQPCCNTYACSGNNACNSTMHCEAYTPDPDECTTTGTCPAGQLCSLAGTCAGGTRACLRCVPTPTGLPAGAACGGTVTMGCATGICANRQCTSTCVPGAAGDAACHTFNARTVCSELSQYSILMDGGRGPTTTFGACIRTCERDSDCDAPLRCGLSAQAVADTLIRTCRAVYGTLGSGAACPLMPTSTSDPAQYCQSGQCFAIGTSTSMGYCASFCTTVADCPTTPAYVCHDIPFFRPSGMGSTVPIRMCERM